MSSRHIGMRAIFPARQPGWDYAVPVASGNRVGDIDVPYEVMAKVMKIYARFPDGLTGALFPVIDAGDSLTLDAGVLSKLPDWSVPCKMLPSNWYSSRLAARQSGHEKIREALKPSDALFGHSVYK